MALRHSRIAVMKMVGVIGFEPTTLWSQTRCATKLRHTPKISIITIVCCLTCYQKYC